jgi:hypothetical protein
MPLFNAVDSVIANPMEGLIMLLPSIAYFTTARLADGRTPLDQSLDNVLYAVTSLISMLTGQPATLDALFELFGLDFSLDIPKLLDDLIFDLLGVPNLGSTLLSNLILGTPEFYRAGSGGDAWLLSMSRIEDRADLLTVLLRTVIELVQNNKDTREMVVTMLANLIIPEGSFGNTALHWGIHFVLWVLRLGGTNLTMEAFQRLINFLAWFLPVIRWVMRLFGAM